MEETRYFVAASYPFENADAWDCKTKYENTLIAWDE